MENRFLPSYTIGPDAYDEIPAVCGKFGKTAVIIGGNKAWNGGAADPKGSGGEDFHHRKFPLW